VIAVQWTGDDWKVLGLGEDLAKARRIAGNRHCEFLTLNEGGDVCFVRGGDKYNPDVKLVPVSDYDSSLSSYGDKLTEPN